MNEQLKEIIWQQQEYEYFKKLSAHGFFGSVFHSAAMTTAILPYMTSACRKQKMRKCLNQVSKGIVLFGVLLCFFLFFHGALLLSWTEPLPPSDSLPVQARTAIDAGDYDKARQLLDAALEEQPDNYWILAACAEVDAATGNFDQAVYTLTDIIMNDIHVQNITSSGHYCYKILKEISPDSLTTSQKRCQDCIAECERYIAKNESIAQYLEQEKYYSALMLCDELKADGTYDYYLYFYYYRCYTGLKAYDECAEYLLGLYGKHTGMDDMPQRYPGNRALLYCLNQLTKQVSPKLRIQIESLQGQ